MKIATPTALSLAATIATTATAQPGHGAKTWFHAHQDDLIDAAMVAIACLIAVVAVRAFWKVLSRP